MNTRRLALAALLLSAGWATAQSPRETVSATIGAAKVSIEYGRPALKGRPVDELLKQLPAHRIWRAGSEQVTTLDVTAPVSIGGQKLAAGKYSLYLLAPEQGDYSLLINKDLGVALGSFYAQAPENLKNEPWPQNDYNTVKAKEAARVTLKLAKVEKPADLFTVTLTPKGVLTLGWGDRAWATEVTAAK